ncbi:MAG: hypothetical protein A3K19_09585 [Lentisphaerae bacterium RIFOXYB12_FULL_65_16]|nr:MAG: hypothetical protein A3K18_03605 [Lentisphaerae bacterium RIFOXYA12_64_32]OGV90502.1 MAG: hypothetical protein A3K19_09585 [Lentisphaerae bacterium RIFOXYB12_FULL_65_16]
MFHRSCMCLALLAAAVVLRAEEIPLAKEELKVPAGGTVNLEFGTVPQQDTTVLLEIVSRLDSKGMGGSMFFLKLTLNGRDVLAARSRTVTRLLNKPLVSPVAPNLPSMWFGSGAWRVLYAPDFESAKAQTFYVEDPYRLVLDVTDLTNPISVNRLTVTNMATAATKSYAGTDGALVVKTLTIRTQPGASPTMAPSAEFAPVINTGQPAAGSAPYKAELLAGGGFRIEAGGSVWDFTSAFSYPNAGLNRLVPDAAPDRTGQAEWQVQATPGAAGGTVDAGGPSYRIKRTVAFTPRKVEVTEAITNVDAAAPLGLLVRHEVSLQGHPDVWVRLAGNPDPAVNEYYAPANPSVHVSTANFGLGLICEDDILRNQARLFYQAEPTPTAGFRTEMLRLAPGETYTMRWSVYPVAGRDYFDFINLVREDWGANFTVEGAWTYFDPYWINETPVEKWRDAFARLGIRYACYCGGWVDHRKDKKRIGFGTGVFDDYWAGFRQQLKDAAKRIRENCPGVKVLVYYDSQRDTAEGGHERYQDSWLTNAKGDQDSTEWNGQYSLTYSVVATLDNTYGKTMLSVADRYLDEMGVDGLYWDEMEHVGYGFPLITHNIPDGHSCILDPKTYTIQREVGITTLLGEGHRLEVIRRVRAKGGFLMGNGPPYTKALMQTGVQRMIEIQHNDTFCYEGNLVSPLGYMGGRMDFGNLTRALGMPTLPVGTRLYDYDTSKYLFPFTPMELHAGYLLGKERIVTLHAGDYGWPGDRSLVQVRHFDAKGKPAAADSVTTVTGESRTAAKPVEGGVAVLEHLPVTLEPAGTSPAEVAQVQYGPDAISLKLTAPDGAVLRVADGGFALRDGQACTVTMGDAVPESVPVAAGALAVTVKPCRDLAIRITAQKP